MKLSKILFESYSKQQLLNIDPMELSEDEYVDEYLQGLFAEFSHGMSELENYVPLDRVRVQYVIIPKENKEDIRFWLKSKLDMEGPASDLDLVKKIGEDKKILEPVILDTRDDFTVEGRHRLSAALKYGLDVPALLIMDDSTR